ncbi:ATP-binding protein [Streptomyces sp. NPDC051636]|uniref:ATP-binding protein n=1 Tax=Streptomyces sp. NPDC051636 TaxID=3365663 RepID=UPI0037B0D2C5
MTSTVRRGDTDAAEPRWNLPVAFAQLLDAKSAEMALCGEVRYRLSSMESCTFTEVRDGPPGHACPSDEGVRAPTDASGVNTDGTASGYSLSLDKGPSALRQVAPPMPVLRQAPTISLSGDSRAVSRARAIARSSLTVIGWQGSVHAATEVLGRLAANAVEHAVTDPRGQKVAVALKINEHDQLVIDVHDPSPHFRDFEHALAGEQGRGLWEMQRLGAHVTWFLPADGNGKVVRATMPPGLVEP